MLTRRVLITGAASSVASPVPASAMRDVHHFHTQELAIDMEVEHYDRYASSDFWFRERQSGRRFCLSSNGDEHRPCLAAFHGSVAVARFRVRPKGMHKTVSTSTLREYVRMLDCDKRLPGRPPFERVITLDQGRASDVQVFGYEAHPGEVFRADGHGPWYLFRQDLYLGSDRAPFLVVLWKHRLTSIRVLDLIPGETTSVQGR